MKALENDGSTKILQRKNKISTNISYPNCIKRTYTEFLPSAFKIDKYARESREYVRPDKSEPKYVYLDKNKNREFGFSAISQKSLTFSDFSAVIYLRCEEKKANILILFQ